MRNRRVRRRRGESSVRVEVSRESALLLTELAKRVGCSRARLLDAVVAALAVQGRAGRAAMVTGELISAPGILTIGAGWSAFGDGERVVGREVVEIDCWLKGRAVFSPVRFDRRGNSLQLSDST